MKPLYVLLVGVAVGWAASGIDWSLEAVGQSAVESDLFGEPASNSEDRHGEPFTKPAFGGEAVLDASGQPIGHYHLKVFGESVGNNGYYVIDSLTGRVWYGVTGGKPQLVVAELPQQ